MQTKQTTKILRSLYLRLCDNGRNDRKEWDTETAPVETILIFKLKLLLVVF